MSSEKVDVKLEIKLLDNGIDFILKGIDELFDSDYELRGDSDAVYVSDSSYKYGVLHLFSGFLLLLKERLYRHAPELPFKGKYQEIRQKLSSNNMSSKPMRTVDCDEAIEKLAIGPRVTFSDDELKVIRYVQSIRNQFEHYSVSVNKIALWKQLSAFVELIDNFLIDELKVSIEESASNPELRRKIKEIEVVQERIKRQFTEAWREDVQKRLRKFKRNPQKAILSIEGEYHSGRGEGYPYTVCPDCGQDTLVVYGDFEGICSNQECRSVSPITACLRCGTPMAGESWEDGDFCSVCYDWMRSD